jgi:hypothetical protein
MDKNLKTIFLFTFSFIIIFYAALLAENKKQETTSIQKPEKKIEASDTDKKLEVNYKDGKIYVFARGASVGEVFAEIAKQAKIEIKVDEETSKGKMTYLVNNKELKQGIEEILNIIGLRDLAISYKEKEIDAKGKKTYVVDKVEIRKRNKEEMAKIEEDEQKEADERARQRDKEYRELFEKMAKEKHKVTKALKDFTDPKITQKEKTKIMTYFRQESFETPEDKALLKNIYLDTKYNELQGAVEMGLAHVIMDHPEEKDKEYLLQLLKKRKMGMVIYSLKFIWDERFIPELIKIVKDKNEFPIGRSQAAEILGAHQVKEAVPVLEEALLQMWGKENITQVWHALSCITGLYYYIENGKIKTTTEKPIVGDKKDYRKIFEEKKKGEK